MFYLYCITIPQPCQEGCIEMCKILPIRNASDAFYPMGKGESARRVGRRAQIRQDSHTIKQSGIRKSTYDKE